MITNTGMGEELDQKKYKEGLRVLNMYFSYIPADKRPWATFAECVDYYTTDHELKAKYPTEINRWRYYSFIETLGGNSFILNSKERLNTAIKRIASKTNKLKAPTTWSFGQSMVDASKGLTFSDIKKIGSDVAKDVKSAAVKVATVGVAGYALWAFGGILAASLLARRQWKS